MKLLLTFALCVLTGQLSVSEIAFEVQPLVIVQGETQKLVMNCSIKNNEVLGIDVIKSLSLSRYNAIYEHFEDLISLDTQTMLLQHSEERTNVQIESGNVFLTLTLQNPTSSDAQVYRCTAVKDNRLVKNHIVEQVKIVTYIMSDENIDKSINGTRPNDMQGDNVRNMDQDKVNCDKDRSRLKFSGNSETIKEHIQPLTLKCVFQVSECDRKNNVTITSLYIMHETNGVIAYVFRNQNVKAPHVKYLNDAFGKLSDKDRHNYLEITFTKLSISQSGKYFCGANIVNFAEEAEILSATFAINVYQPNFTDVIHLVNDLENKMKELKIMQEKIKHGIILGVKNELEKSVAYQLQSQTKQINKEMIDMKEEIKKNFQELFFDSSSILTQIQSDLATREENTAQCEAKFYEITDGHLYTHIWVSTSVMTYNEARDDCRAKGAHLLTLKTQDKLKLLALHNPDSEIWVGLTDMDSENVFRWDDDQSICNQICRNSIFLSGEPNDGLGNEDCATYYPLYKVLNDVNCAMKRRYICEIYSESFK